MFKHHFRLKSINSFSLNPIQPGLFEARWAWGRKVPLVYKTINDIEMKFSGVVENHKLINLV